MNFEDVEAKDDADGLLECSGTFGIDDGGGGGAGYGHLGIDLVTQRVAGLELREKVDPLVIGDGEDGQGE
jgi:hypothetical protein